ncbi:hypothetical protein BXT86_00235 [candidate division WOR-3 bacterium 4484_100]|uniref:DDH domain-containing protein n=1 Tax=candidate division WOR-3 bacterium 4484_100 TaxID=1936077 RepID=A0A1V4QIE4_UNCW3|nr:MAG: hypothetical protein BXT86_00235 [candidate division WOR-3 bacterium 4484_100]
MRSLKKFTGIIKKSSKILIATHRDPDTDGIAAALACVYLVKHFKKRNIKIYCNSTIPARYKFLLRKFQFTKKIPEFDLLIAVDSAGLNRIFPKANIEEIKKNTIINIDHHRSNDAFGQLQIIDERASSACEIIYRIFKSLKIKINHHLAEIFYCGLYNETGGFTYPNTTSESLKIAAEMISLGIKPAPLIKLLNAKTLAGTKLLSDVLSTIEIKDGVGIMILLQKMLKKNRAKISDTENFISFLQAINGVRVSLFLREEKNQTRVSLRSDGIIDVNRLAQKYGGGGHRLAAGIRMKMGIVQTKQEILRAIRNEMRRTKG